MRPTVRGLMEEYEGRVEILVMDYDDRSLDDYRRENGATGHPSFAAINADGQVVDVIIGPVPAETLEALVALIAGSG
jgi:thioredoxin-like negative regulator of GroEL